MDEWGRKWRMVSGGLRVMRRRRNTECLLGEENGERVLEKVVFMVGSQAWANFTRWRWIWRYWSEESRGLVLAPAGACSQACGVTAQSRRWKEYHEKRLETQLGQRRLEFGLPSVVERSERYQGRCQSSWNVNTQTGHSGSQGHLNQRIPSSSLIVFAYYFTLPSRLPCLSEPLVFRRISGMHLYFSASTSRHLASLPITSCLVRNLLFLIWAWTYFHSTRICWISVVTLCGNLILHIIQRKILFVLPAVHQFFSHCPWDCFLTGLSEILVWPGLSERPCKLSAVLQEGSFL